MNMLNIKFIKYVKSTDYLYAIWEGDHDIYIQEYKGNLGKHKHILHDEYEAILKEVDGYHLEYQLTTTLDNIQALYKKALEFSEEAERVKNLTIDEAITEIMQDKK